MILIRTLFDTLSKTRVTLLVLVGIIAGLINTYLLYLINSFLTTSESGQGNYLLFGIAIIAFIVINIYFSKGLITISQKMVQSLREEIYQKILLADYNFVQQSRDNIYTTVTTDVNLIAESFLYLIQVIVSFATIVSCLAYLAWLSVMLFLLTIGVLAFGVLIYIVIIKKTYPKLRKARDIQDKLIFQLNEILNGIKELIIYPRKKAVLQSQVSAALDQAYDHNRSALVNLASTRIIGQSLLFSYLGVLLFLSAFYFTIAQSILLSYCIVLLYILRPIEVLMNLIAPISKANIAAQKALDLIRNLEPAQRGNGSTESHTAIPFESFQFKGIHYAHKKEADTTFEVGPFDFDVKKGDVVFIFGGNGSGKTTLFNVLLGIYPTESKSLFYNEKKFDVENWYGIANQLFAPVFSDFHLFNKFYGIDTIDQETLNYYFKLFEIDHKVKATDNGFSNLDLSTGQRKRLALINAILENRPVLVLDEWAADQDPYFRKKFYTEIIPLLVKELDKTIIAITHDDQYFNVADHLFRMDYGQLTRIPKENMKTNFFQ